MIECKEVWLWATVLKEVETRLLASNLLPSVFFLFEESILKPIVFARDFCVEN